MKENNEGFSLIELIIVIAIMALMATMAFYGLGYLSRADAKGCAQDINSGISSVKATTMTKTQGVYLYLYRVDDTYYLKKSTNPHDTATASGNGVKKIGGAGSMKIYCDGAELTSSKLIKIEATRKDGTFVSGPKHIEVKGGGNYSVWLIKNTGKHFVRTDR